MSNTGSVILAIDTTSRRGSVALSRGGRIVALWGLESSEPQSAVLWEDVDRLLARARLGIGDVDAFAVARGPGAFTGLRVGIAAAMGLARATGRPLYGATSLELVARAAGPASRVWAVLNAYRDEVYAQPFAVDGGAEPLDEPLVAAADALFATFEPCSLVVTGDGAVFYGEALAAAAASRGARLERGRDLSQNEKRWSLVAAPPFLAGELALLAGAWLADGREPEPVTPCYVRASEAELNLGRGLVGGAGVPR
jgi:tRNA threonylcarbamoyladenosine biosynthesis protein TsaB